MKTYTNNGYDFGPLSLVHIILGQFGDNLHVNA